MEIMQYLAILQAEKVAYLALVVGIGAAILAVIALAVAVRKG